MNIVVCVKYVPDAQSERAFREQDKTVDRDAVDGLLSEVDEYAVEEALKIVEASEGEVTVLTALVLAEAIKKATDGAPELVLMGMTSTDGVMGVVPAMVAERLGMPQVTFASELTIEGGSLRARRDGDAASDTIEASLPALVSVGETGFEPRYPTDQINEPRYPSFKGIMAAKKKPVEQWTLADLGVDAGAVGIDAAWTKVIDVAKRPPRAQGTIVKDEGDGGTKLAEFLAAGKFL